MNQPNIRLRLRNREEDASKGLYAVPWKLAAAQLAPWMSDYIPTKGSPNRGTVKGLEPVAPFVEVDVTGKPLKKQLGSTTTQKILHMIPSTSFDEG